MTPDRMEEGPARLMAGLRRFHEMANAGMTIGPQWQDFAALCPIPNVVEGAAYGINCQYDMQAGRFEYMTAVEVSAFPEDGKYDRLRMEPALYAVFAHPGPVMSIGDTWTGIFRDWLPASDYTAHEVPCYERYGPGYDAEKGEGDIEIWFPVLKKPA